MEISSLYPACKGVRQLLADELGAVGQHGNVAGGLQIIERCVVVQAVCTGVPLRRQGGHVRVCVALTAADHLTKAVVCPDLYYVLRQVKAALLVQFHSLAVKVRAADGVGVVLLDQRTLLPDEAGDERTALFGGVILGVSSQKGLSPCPRKPMFHTVGVVFCRSMASCQRARNFSGYRLNLGSSSGYACTNILAPSGSA